MHSTPLSPWQYVPLQIHVMFRPNIPVHKCHVLSKKQFSFKKCSVPWQDNSLSNQHVFISNMHYSKWKHTHQVLETTCPLRETVFFQNLQYCRSWKCDFFPSKWYAMVFQENASLQMRRISLLFPGRNNSDLHCPFFSTDTSISKMSHSFKYWGFFVNMYVAFFQGKSGKRHFLRFNYAVFFDKIFFQWKNATILQIVASVKSST